MSAEVASEHVCYVHCNFCNTVLAKKSGEYTHDMTPCVNGRSPGLVWWEREKEMTKLGWFVPFLGKITCWPLFWKENNAHFVSVPCNTLLSIGATVRCGHCATLLPVNLGALLQPAPLHDNYNQNLLKDKSDQYEGTEYGSSSKHGRTPMTGSAENGQFHTPEKRQRVPSAYNRFIKEEIQRIKASNPDISHREAFSAAAKNWAHFPYIHFGLNLDNRKQVNSNEKIASEGAPK